MKPLIIKVGKTLAKEEFNKKHVMKLVNIYARRGYDITKITK